MPPEEIWWVVLADFGISKRDDEGNAPTTAIKGTDGFMAPELLGFPNLTRPKHIFDFKAVDMWALGEIAFRMLTGEATFQSPWELVEYCQGQRPLPSDRLPSRARHDTENFISRLLEISPKSRMTTTQCLTHSWMATRNVNPIEELTGLNLQPSNSLQPTQPSTNHENHDESASWSAISALEPSAVQTTAQRPPAVGKVSKEAERASESSKKSATTSKEIDKKTAAKSTKLKPKEEPTSAKDDLLDSGFESEAEQVKTTANAEDTENEEDTQDSWSIAAVDDNNSPSVVERDSKEDTSLPLKKERVKVVRQAGTSSWGFWSTATPKQVRQKANEGVITPLKGSSSAVMVRERLVRKQSNPEPEKSEREKKTSIKPTPKRANTFSLFGPTPTRSKPTRTRSIPKSISQSQSRRESPERTDKIPQVSIKAAKLMGIQSTDNVSASRRTSVKSKGKTAEIRPINTKHLKAKLIRTYY
jgi:serine/threonine protein kinase